MKDKLTAILLAFFLGGLGVHQFYLNNNVRGILYILFCWTFIPSMIAVIDIIILAIMSEDSFNNKYNQGHTSISNRLNTADELEKLHELKNKGVLTDKEFQERKKKLLQ